jgi:TonB-linked SusC/RagA family outer membrane protein
MKSVHKRRIFTFLIIIITFNGWVRAQDNDRETLQKQDTIRNIPYGTQPSWAVSGSISTVSGEELQKTFAPNLGNALFGRLPGLTVLQNGSEPGLDSPGLMIRGTGTFGSGKNVLVIVDGVESPYAQLVAEEIDNITVLKDASATAMYGSKGANGVLLVTTKRGVKGPLKVSFGIRQGISSPTDLPAFLGSYDYAKLYNEALMNDGLPEHYTAEDLAAYKDGSDPYFHPDVNWYDQVLRKTSPTSAYDLNFTGGSDNVKYFVLLNMLNQQGLYKKTGDLSDNSINSNYWRYNFRSNVDIKLSDNLSAIFTLGGVVEDKSNPDNNNTSNIFNRMSLIAPNAFPVNTPRGELSGSNLNSNPWGDLLEKGLYTSNGRTLQVSFSLKEKLDFITKGLSITGLVSFNNSFTSLSNKSRTYLSYNMSKGIAGDTIYTPIGINSELSSSEGVSDQWRSYAIQSFLNYDRTFGNTAVNAVMMFNSSNYAYTGMLDALPYKDMGLFGRYTFINRQKYIAELSFGYNGSESFPKGSRWGLFPAGSLAWVISNEDFLKGNQALTYLKVRGSYGLTGNDNIGASRRYNWLEDYVSFGSYYLGNPIASAGTIGEGQPADSSTTWEKQKQMNFGIEATLYDRIDISVDIFNQNRYDILASPYRTVPQFIGISTISGLGGGDIFPESNVGKVNNKGFEIGIRYHGDNTKDLQYFIEGNLWYAKNKIEYNAEAIQLNEYLYRTGHPVGQPFVLEAIGFFADQTDIDNSPKQNYVSVLQPGDIKYKDQNNDGIIDQNDSYPLGKTANPTLNGSLHAGINYKGFDLDIVLQGVTGNTVLIDGTYFEAFQNNGKVSEIALGRWTPSTAATATYPRLSASNNLNNFRASSLWQKDASYLKLRSVELGYSLPKSFTKTLKLLDTRVYLNATNLFSLDHLDFSDPEAIYGYPPMRTFNLGIRIQF